MAYKCYKMTYSRPLDDHIKDYICDTAEDFKSLPKSAPLSTAIEAKDGTMQIVNASGEWVPFG